MNSFPNLSVIIPVRNRERYLRAAVESVLAEQRDSLSIEVIVVDDGSSDRTLATVQNLPLRLLSTSGDRGFSHARNVGIRASHSPYLTFLDSDDLIAAGSLIERVAWLDAHPDRDAIGARIASLIDAEGETIGSAEDLIYRRPERPHWSMPDRLTLDEWNERGNFFLPSWCFVYRRELFDRIGLFDETLRMAVERELAFRVLRVTDLDFLPIGAVHYRWHSENTSVMRLPQAGTRYADRPTSTAERYLVDLQYGRTPA